MFLCLSLRPGVPSLFCPFNTPFASLSDWQLIRVCVLVRSIFCLWVKLFFRHTSCLSNFLFACLYVCLTFRQFMLLFLTTPRLFVCLCIKFFFVCLSNLSFTCLTLCLTLFSFILFSANQYLSVCLIPVFSVELSSQLSDCLTPVSFVCTFI